MTPGVVAANQIGVSSHAGPVASKNGIQGRNTEVSQIQAHRRPDEVFADHNRMSTPAKECPSLISFASVGDDGVVGFRTERGRDYHATLVTTSRLIGSNQIMSALDKGFGS